MNVSEIMTRDVKACLPSEPLTRVAQIMWEQDCGCVPVLSGNGRPVGMITDRDVCMAALTQGGRLDQVPVERVMSRTAYTCKASDDLQTPHDIMREHRVRRLPVVDGDGKLVGLLSLADISRAAVKQMPETRRNDWARQLTRTLSEISQTHCELAEATKPQPLLAKAENLPKAGESAAKKA